MDRPTNQLPEQLRAQIKNARVRLRLSQAEVAKRINLTQAHVSGIENGRVIPRYDTLLNLVQILEMDLILVPRSKAFLVKSIIKDINEGREPDLDRPLFADMEEEEETEGDPDFGR